MATFIRLFLGCFTLFLLSHSSNSRTLRRSTRHSVFKREEESASSSSYDQALPIIEEAARLLPIDQFSDDPYLLQKVDRVNTMTAYHTPYKPEGKDSDVVYERNSIDKDKDIIVLSSSEDHVNLKSHSSKQTYVVLRKNPKTLSTTYYAAYAYVRNATNFDTDTVDVAGSKKFIEWDTWEDRTLKRAVRWSSCTSSILVACGFNPAAFAQYGLAMAPNGLGDETAKRDNSSTATVEKKEQVESVNRTKPTVNKDDAEYEMDNYDFFDDLNIDMVHGRAAGETAGTIGGTAANVGCGMVGWVFGGTCGGGKAKKTIIIKKAPTIHPITMKPPGGPGATPGGPGGPPGPSGAYLPLGTPNIPPTPPFMDGMTPTTGIFYPDNRQIPPVDGTMIPVGGIRKPYLYEGTDPNTFGAKLPKDKGTTGSYAPPQSQPVHGIMLPVSAGTGIFIPDGMAYPSRFNGPGTPVHAYSIPGFPGHPDLWVPDSDITNPLRKGDPNTPVQGTVVPDPPNISKQQPKPGVLLLNKMPIIFIPSSLNPAKSVFTDDPKKLPPISGLLIPGVPGTAEVFIPDKDDQVKGLNPPPQGTMTPNSPSTKAPEHGLLFPGAPSADPLFIPDDAGGLYKFNPTNPSDHPSDGVLTPANPQTTNDYYPNQPAPPKPALIPGVMTPVNNPKKKTPIPGNLIVNKPVAPFQFVPNGVGTSGTIKPSDGRPPVKGIWVPGVPGAADEYIPYDEPTGGLPPLKGNFSPDNNPGSPVSCQTGPPARPDGPPTITGGPRPPPNMAPVPIGGNNGDGGPGSGEFIPDMPPGGAPSPMQPVNPPVEGQPIPFNPSANFPAGNFPRGVAKIPGLPPQHGKVVPPLSPGGPATFVPDPPQTGSGSFTPSSPSGSIPKKGFVGPPFPPREGEPTKFTPDNPADAPKQDTPGSLNMPGQPPDRGVLHPAPYEGAPCPFTPFSPTTFVPDKNPAPVEGSAPPGPIPNGDPKQEVPFYPDNPLQIPPGVAPQRGKLQRLGAPAAPGILKAPTGPGTTPIFIPDPINSKPCEVIPDQNPLSPSPGSATMPFNPSDPITFRPDDRKSVPPGDNKGILRVPGGFPPESHGTIKNPPDTNQPVLFVQDKPAIFTPSTPPGSIPVPGFKEDPKGPNLPLKFYPTDPSQLTQIPTPGTLSSPSDPTFTPVTGLLRPDYPPPAYSFLPFVQGQFTPDATLVPSPGGVEQPSVPGQNPNFYPAQPASLTPAACPGTLKAGSSAPEQHGTLEPSTSPPSGPRPFTPDPQGSFYPDSNPTNTIPVSIQPMGNTPTDPSKIRAGNPTNPVVPGTGTLKSPGKPDQHGTAAPPNPPGGPSIFTPDPPGSKPASFIPESNPGSPVPGTYSDNPPSFKPSNPGALPPLPARGSVQPTNPPGPPMTGTLSPGPGGPGGPLTWTPDSAATFHPDGNLPPVPGTCPVPKSPDDPVPFFPTTPTMMPPGLPKGTLDFPGHPDKRGTMEPNPQPTAQPSWVFKPDRPDSTFVPALNPGSQIPGTSGAPTSPGAPFPFYPQNPKQMPPGGPFKGNLNKPGEPPKTGTLLPPTAPGQPYMFQEQPASLFYKDADPFSPIAGVADRSAADPTGTLPIPFDPSNPQQFQQSIPMDTPGILKSPGVPDAHGYMEPSKGLGQKPKFYPDPPGSYLASFFPDRSPYTPTDGMISPAPPSGGPQTFRPSDTSKLNPSADDHGQMVPKMPGASPESGTLSPPKTPGAPYTWTPDPEGSTPAWFYKDSNPTQPIRGLYIPPPAGSAAEAPAAFKPTNVKEGPQQNEHGQMKKDNPPSSPPETGTLKPPISPGLHPFVPDAKCGIPAIFYPDISSAGPINGIYTPGGQGTTPGSFKPDNPTLTAKLPAPGQMCPSGPNQPQIHGVLKAAAFPSMPLMFLPDDKSGIPEYEVSLVPQGEKVPTDIQITETTTVSIRGSYFQTTITTTIFIAFTGSTGMFIINGVPPSDPKVEGIFCTFVPKQSSGDGSVVMTPDTKAGGLKPSEIPSGTQGSFFPAGATITGIPGQWFPNPNNAAEYIFRPGSPPQAGTWKSKTNTGCFMFDEQAKLTPFDIEWLKKRDADFAKPQVSIRAFNFQGTLNQPKWDIFMPIDGTLGKFQVTNAQTVVHGFLKPEEETSVTKGVFTPDDPMILQSLAGSGPVMGSFEQDDTPASSGIFPGNGITGNIVFAGGVFTMTFNSPGRKGNLTPGKKPLPGFFVYCFGLVQNVLDSKGQEMKSNPVQQGNNLSKGRGFGRKPASSLSSDSQVPTPTPIGRSFGPRPKVDPSQTTSENMEGGQALNQNFAAYLQNQAAAGGQGMMETKTETKTEKREEIQEETEEVVMQVPMGMQIAQNQMQAVQQMGGYPAMPSYGGMVPPGYGGGAMMPGYGGMPSYGQQQGMMGQMPGMQQGMMGQIPGMQGMMYGQHGMMPGQMYGQGMMPGQMYGQGMMPGQMPAQGMMPGQMYGQGMMPMMPGQMYGQSMMPGQMPAQGMMPGQMYGQGMMPGQMPAQGTMPGQMYGQGMMQGQMPGQGMMMPGQMPGQGMMPGQVQGMMPGMKKSSKRGEATEESSSTVQTMGQMPRQTPMGRSMMKPSAMPKDLQNELIAMGGRPMTLEELQKHLTPQVMQQMQEQLQQLPQTPMGRSMIKPSPMPQDLQKELEALGGRPMTLEELQKHLTPQVMQQMQEQLQQSQQPPTPMGRSMMKHDETQREIGGQFISSGPETTNTAPASGEVEGTAYRSTTGGNIFIPTSGTAGVFFLIGTSDLRQILGTLLNTADTKVASLKSPELSKLIDELKKGSVSGVFVPSGGSGEAGGIQLSLSLIGSDVVVSLTLPGTKGSLLVPNAGESVDSSKGEYAIGLLSTPGQLVPPTPVLDGVHGTFYKMAPKDVFFADYPGTPGTFYGSSGSPARGNFFPSVSEGKEMFWGEDDALAELLPIGKDLMIVGKFVPDEIIGESVSPDGGGLLGSLKSGKVPRSFVFKADVAGQSGTISKTDPLLHTAKAKGRGFGDNKEANFVADAAVDIDDHPGWLTQFEIIVPNITLKYDDEIFFGFGNCPHRSDLSPAVLSQASSDDAVVDFYMGLLRTGCLPSQNKYIKTLIQEGYLQVKNKLIVVPEDSKYLKLAKLTQKQTEKLSSAFEMCVFTLTYSDEVKKGVTTESLLTHDNKRISRSVKYLIDMSILSMKMSRELCCRHSVRLSRNLITSLTTALTKLKQDLETVKDCEKCTQDKEIIHNDSMQLMGMMQYVMHGLASINPAESIRNSYETFYTAHAELIHRKVVQVSED